VVEDGGNNVSADGNRSDRRSAQRITLRLFQRRSVSRGLGLTDFGETHRTPQRAHQPAQHPLGSGVAQGCAPAGAESLIRVSY
jgi:hypothetical protein